MLEPLISVSASDIALQSADVERKGVMLLICNFWKVLFQDTKPI